MNPVRTCLLAILCLSTVTSFAAVPVQIPVQGFLTDAADAPVNGNVAITFKLFDSSSDPVALWVESHPAVPVQDGIYTVHLGTITALTQNLLDNPELWLETMVNGETLTPRVRVASVPYALRSGITETITPQNLSQVISLMQSTPDADGDGHTKLSQGGDDCDDLDPAVYAGAPEICDGKDNDCDGVRDEGFATHWYVDADEDGFGDPTTSTLSCVPVNGYVNNGEDRDDTNPAVNPEAGEVCDGVDNNCNDEPDEGLLTTWYHDSDQDGYGDPNDFVESCTPVPGYVEVPDDCDDLNPNVNPTATEECDGLDNNCDGLIDNDSPIAPSWFQDADADGYGDPNNEIVACDPPPGYVADNTDCNDFNSSINPAASEVCDDMDNDCDGSTDEDAVDALIWYRDADQDGFGDPGDAILNCIGLFGYVSNNLDCNDANANVNPAAPENCANGMDDDCDGMVDAADPNCQ